MSFHFCRGAQPLLESLNQPVKNLVDLAKIRDVAISTPTQLLDLYGVQQQLCKGEGLMVKFKRQVRLLDCFWIAFGLLSDCFWICMAFSSSCAKARG